MTITHGTASCLVAGTKASLNHREQINFLSWTVNTKLSWNPSTSFGPETFKRKRTPSHHTFVPLNFYKGTEKKRCRKTTKTVLYIGCNWLWYYHFGPHATNFVGVYYKCFKLLCLPTTYVLFCVQWNNFHFPTRISGLVRINELTKHDRKKMNIPMGIKQKFVLRHINLSHVTKYYVFKQLIYDTNSYTVTSA
jgi:hypothetical protein